MIPVSSGLSEYGSSIAAPHDPRAPSLCPMQVADQPVCVWFGLVDLREKLDALDVEHSICGEIRLSFSLD